MMKPFEQPLKHRARYEHRLASNPREKVFLRAWQKEQKQSHILQWLLCASDDQNSQERDLTQAEATCAATLIQWLGSPVGFCFLKDTLRDMGITVEERLAPISGFAMGSDVRDDRPV